MAVETRDVGRLAPGPPETDLVDTRDVGRDADDAEGLVVTMVRRDRVVDAILPRECGRGEFTLEGDIRASKYVDAVDLRIDACDTDFETLPGLVQRAIFHCYIFLLRLLRLLH